jgi:hypothetical protein
MASIQSPYGKKDFRLSKSYDLVLNRKNDQLDLALTGVSNPIQTMEQIIRMALKTTKGTMLKEPNFGASTADDRYARREETFKVTTKSMQRLQGFIHENLRTSGINPDAYPYTVLVAKAGLEAVAIRIEFAIISFENIASYTIDSVFNTTTNNLVSFNAFGD